MLPLPRQRKRLHPRDVKRLVVKELFLRTSYMRSEELVEASLSTWGLCELRSVFDGVFIQRVSEQGNGSILGWREWHLAREADLGPWMNSDPGLVRACMDKVTAVSHVLPLLQRVWVSLRGLVAVLAVLDLAVAEERFSQEEEEDLASLGEREIIDRDLLPPALEVVRDLGQDGEAVERLGIDFDEGHEVLEEPLSDEALGPDVGTRPLVEELHVEEV